MQSNSNKPCIYHKFSAFISVVLFFHLLEINHRLPAGPHPRTRDFTTGSTSCGSQSTVSRCCRARCESVSARSSGRPATRWASISCGAFWRATMYICFCRSRRNCLCPMRCSVSRAGRRGASRWSSPNCASATGEDGSGPGAISRRHLGTSRTTSSFSIWNYIPNGMLPASAGSGSLAP
jgi:hypothetical protein